MINNTALKTLSFSIITAFMLSACGGSDSDNKENKTSEKEINTNENTQPTEPTKPTDTKTENILTFPVGEFSISGGYYGTEELYAVWENNKTQINNTLSEKIYPIYEQKTDKNGWWWHAPEYILTKDKLYYKEHGQHQLYIVQNTDSTLTLSFDSDGQGLTQTITFKNIDLANEQLNSGKVTTGLLGSFSGEQTNTNKTKLINAISQLSNSFGKNATCHQYLTHQYNHQQIFFDSNDTISNKNLEKWINEQKNQGINVVEETWGKYKVAYIPDSDINHFMGSHRIATSRQYAVEIDGKLYRGYFDNAKLYNYQDEYDYKTRAQFNDGICNLYNESAAQTLKTALQSLPKN